MKAIPNMQHLSDLILFHHEHYDGTGYPQNLKGEEIPYLSRAVSIIEAYECMIGGRVYSPVISHKEAIKILKKKSGKDFDPILVDKFISIF